MAKNIVLKPLNRTTWNLKKVPDNVENLLARIKKSSVDSDDSLKSSDDIAIINNTGLKEITAYTSFDGKVVDSLVVTPSGVAYQFTVDVTSEDFDFEWWSFALKNYHVVVATSLVKKQLADFVGLDIKEISGKIVYKGKKSDEESAISLQSLFDVVCPE